MSTAAFFRAARLQPPVILRLRLRPLTIGHLQLLHELESPFVSAPSPLGPEPGLYDLLLAIFVCSQTHADSRRNLRAWWLGIFFRVWSFTLRGSWKVEDNNPISEMVRFREYLTEAQKGPELNTEFSGDLRQLGSPSLHIMRVRLMSELHIPYPDTLDLTVIEARELLAVRYEMDGGSIWSDRQEGLWKFKQEMDAKKGAKN